MKILLRGKVQTEIPILGAMGAVSCDEVALDARDVTRVTDLCDTTQGRMQLAMWWNDVLDRFVNLP